MEIVNLKKQFLATSGNTVSNRFSGPANREPVEPLKVGDTFNLGDPSTWEVFCQAIPGSTSKYQFLNVEVTDEGGKKSVKQVSPNIFSRRVRVYDEEGNQTDETRMSSGTVFDVFSKQPTAQAAMEAISGKNMVVKDAERVKARSFTDAPYREVWIYKIDFE